MLESALFEGISKKYCPSVLVATTLNLCENVLKCKIEPKLQPSQKANRQEIAECFKDLCIVLQGTNKYDLSALKRKYSRSRFHNIAKIKLNVN